MTTYTLYTNAGRWDTVNNINAAKHSAKIAANQGLTITLVERQFNNGPIREIKL